MNDYTYEIPDNNIFLKTLLKYLKAQNETRLYNLIKGTECYIECSGRYSNIRWNGYATNIDFRVPIEIFSEFDENTKENLRKNCNTLIPDVAGLDVLSVTISPQFYEGTEESLEDDLEVISKEILDKTGICYPPDLYEKGKDMAEVYLYIFHIENTLRMFIEQEGNNNLKFTRDLETKIKNRKEQEKNQKWRTFRGDSDLFYLDLGDLGKIISYNWDIFKNSFPNLDWIKLKIDEISECRNCIAHNCYIGDHEKAVLKVNYNGILRQLGKKSE